MLQAIRDRVTGIVAIFILGLLAIPFVFFGLDSYIRTVPENAVAQVGDAEITVSEFETEFARERQRRRQEQGEAYDDLAFNTPQSRREFLESMIDRELLVQHARDLGLTISPNTSDRRNEPQMSPTACSWKRSRNQWSEAPCMGKVSPPPGPWNDRMPMVMVGP